MLPAEVPYRGAFGARRPGGLTRLRLPPAPMPSRNGWRPLKAWRYVGVYGPEVMLCVAQVRIGPARQTFWAVWLREQERLHERTVLGRGAVRLEPGRVSLLEPTLELHLDLDEHPGIETVCASGDSYAWTRKQGGVSASGTLLIDGQARPIRARAVIDDTAAYYQRHTRWLWCAGVGTASDGRELAWNLVSGVNDPPHDSERTVWIDGQPAEIGPCRFNPDLSGVDALDFTVEAERQRRENRLLVRSCYRQPFGTFSGQLPGGVELDHGYGVMEAHEVWW